MSRIFREIFCGHFPWKSTDENLRKISPKFRRIFSPISSKNFARTSLWGIAGTTLSEQLEWRHLFYRGAPKSSKNKKNILSGRKLLRTFFWCLYRKGVAIHACLTLGAVSQDVAQALWKRVKISSGKRHINFKHINSFCRPSSPGLSQGRTGFVPGTKLASIVQK